MQNLYKRIRKKGYPYFLVLPAILFVLMVTFLPLIEGISYSFYRTEYLDKVEFIGLANYVKFFTSSEVLGMLLTSFIYLLGSVILILPVSFGLAIIINQKIHFRTPIRAILILPWAISEVVVAFLWKWMLNPYYGPISYLIYTFFGIAIPSLMTHRFFAMPFLIFVTAWKFFPLPMLFILAALQAVPFELYEAAKIDGGSFWDTFRYITFPLVKNTLLVSIVLISVFILNSVPLVLTLTGGGPGGVTETLALGTFKEAFKFWHVGSGASMAVILFLFAVILSLIYIKILKTEKYY